MMPLVRHFGGWNLSDIEKETFLMVRPSPAVSLNNPLNDSHVSGDPNYINSCALRLSIALSSYGIDLNGAPGANNIGAKGNSQALGGKKHVIISAAQMATYLRTLLGTPDYLDDGDNGYNTPQAGDIIVFGDDLHVGMCPGNNTAVGSFISGPVWLLQRSTLDD